MRLGELLEQLRAGEASGRADIDAIVVAAGGLAGWVTMVVVPAGTDGAGKVQYETHAVITPADYEALSAEAGAEPTHLWGYPVRHGWDS